MQREHEDEASEIDPWDKPEFLAPKITEVPDSEWELLEDDEAQQLMSKLDSEDEWVVNYPPSSFSETHPLAVESRRNHKKFLHALSKTGSALKAARLAGQSRRSFYLAKQKFPDFARNWDIAIAIYQEFEVEDNLRKRAIDGVREPVYYQGNIVGYTIKYDSGLTQFYVRANMRDKYGDKSEVSINGHINHGVMVLPTQAVNQNDWEREAQEAMANQKMVDITPTVVDTKVVKVQDAEQKRVTLGR